MTTTAPRLLTADELLRLDLRGELIRGVFCEMSPTGEEHGVIVMRLGHYLNAFIIPRGLGRVMGSDMGVWLERGPDTVREPDIAFTSARRSPPGAWSKGYAEVVPDLVVEVRSPSDSRRAARAKAEMWLSHGVRLVWVVHPDSRTIDVHAPDGAVATLAGDGALDGGEVLPGFSCPLAALFDA